MMLGRMRAELGEDIGLQAGIELAVERWTAWAPGLEDADSWRAWADGAKRIEGPVTPDVGFVEPMLRRRMSPQTRMTLKVAKTCLDGESTAPAFVFCSRYGEVHRSHEILTDLAKGEIISPMAFSTSVHNTPAGFFSIATRDTAPSTALASGEATLENAFVEAWCMLRDGTAEKALLVYHDEPLPPVFSSLATSVRHSAAIALLLRVPGTPEHRPRLTLSCRPRPAAEPMPSESEDPALQTLRLLIKGGDAVTVDTGRLIWTWHRRETPA